MEPYRARFRGAPTSVREAREAVVDYSRLCGFVSTELHDIEVAVGEALANAVEHGTKDLGFIGVSCAYDGRALTIEVRDDGIGFDYTLTPRRDPRSVRGFGIMLMRSLMDEVHYLAHGNVVRLMKLGPAAASSGLEREEEA